ncbi:MAG: hypothetical protein KCHDKBKB_02718 [Elusimicrobia bacterium]|nr:hypothetical protein [Elusimicrobiota bacterium]
MGLSCLAVFQLLHATSLDGLSKSLLKGASSLKSKKIAVLALPYHDGRVSSGSSIVSERLTTLLVGKRGVHLVERRLIQQLLAEKKLNETGIIDQENLRKIGNVLDVEAIITGTLIDLKNDKTEINARLIQVDSGEVLSAGQEIIERSWSDSPVTPKLPEKPVPQIPKEAVPAEAAVIENSSLPLPMKVPLKLSNESFPPSRRIYHGKETVGPKKKLNHPKNYNEQERDDDYGPLETTSEKFSHSSKKIQEKEAEEPTIKHPTEVGVVQEDYAPRKPLRRY